MHYQCRVNQISELSLLTAIDFALSQQGPRDQRIFRCMGMVMHLDFSGAGCGEIDPLVQAFVRYVLDSGAQRVESARAIS